MSDYDQFDWFSTPADIETVSAQRRLPDRTYASKGFLIDNPASRDYGQPARFVYKVFDADVEREIALDGEAQISGSRAGLGVEIHAGLTR